MCVEWIKVILTEGWVDVRYKSSTSTPQRHHWDFCFLLQLCPFSPSPNPSEIFSPHSPNPTPNPQHPPSPSTLPKDLFMEAESLNPNSLYSSEAVRWQLLMSMLMLMLMALPQRSKRRPRCRQSWILISEVAVRWGGGDVLCGGWYHESWVFFPPQTEQLCECIHGKQRRMRQTAQRS